jgi:DNA end-binding protein Ku
MRSIWKGHIRFLLVAIPVRVYNALETSEKVHLNQLHKEDYGPIGYDKRCKKCRQIVSNEEIIKGYQYAPDQYAILHCCDIAKRQTEDHEGHRYCRVHRQSRDLADALDSPYFAGPDGEVGVKTYALLSEVLKESGRSG